MDTYTALLIKLLPVSALPYLKALVTLLGSALSVFLATYPNADHRFVIASAAVTIVGTYLTPNIKPVTLQPVVAQSADAEPLTYGGVPAPVVPVNEETGTPAVVAAAPAPLAPVKEVGV